ncbi:hypothetical protein ATO12_18700 [Aquimarina atlantica]|uniref:HYR domain-containing protein n=1 Tax=Aquimarina atlantica TaxID=1317122 RepID=A0A023BST4_9FLAO|nr:T9SS C-terminal target domain-containing protein [Aquimarina atlantica]EZH73046.1 hypothetical protein ATO12_18700 [Aquimarina atlantica]
MSDTIAEKHTLSGENIYPENRGVFVCGKTLFIVSFNTKEKYSFVVNNFFQKMRNSRIRFTRKLEFSIKMFTLYLMVLGNVFMSFGQGCPDVPISGTDETQRFSVYGENETDDVGESVSEAGDINGDGIADIIIGAPGVDSGGQENIGEAYVIFGGTGITSSSVDITSLDGKDGFVIRGLNANEGLGVSVSTAGDINDDEIDDILIGNNSGDVIVIFGKDTKNTTDFSAVYTRTDINNDNGIIIEDTASNTGFGQTLSNAGDVNGDTIDDIIIGTSSFSGGGDAYVFYGNSAIRSMDVAALVGTNGFKIEGFAQFGSGSGLKVSNAGDINDDNIDDLVLGYPSYDEGGMNGSGRVVVVYGSGDIAGFPPVFQLSSLNGMNGFYITENIENERLGNSVASAKDFNDDGIDDLAINSATKTYVIYGKDTLFGTSFGISDLAADAKFVFEAGWYQYPYRPSDVDGLSDVNGDGVTDLIVSIPHGDGYARSGGVYIIYGGSSLPPTLASLELIGSNGYQVFDDQRYSYKGFGHSVSNVGDFNNDGFNDFIVGEKINYSNIHRKKGATHVFFGNTFNVIDAIEPTINCPNGTQELYANSRLPNYIHFLPSVSDNCSYNTEMSYTQTPPEGTLFTTNTNVTITVTDRSGNISSCNFMVNVKTTTEEIDCSTTSFSVNNLNGTNGLVLYGEKPHSETGYDVSPAGDINGDDIDDFIVVAKGDVVNHTGPYDGYHIDVTGGVYIIYGTNAGFPPNINLKYLDVSAGFKINNDTAFHQRTSDDNQFYKADTAGDINGDTIDDIMISEPLRGNGSTIRLGYTYIIFGTRAGFSSTFDLSTLNGKNGFTVIGTVRNEGLGIDLDNVGDINGDTIDDIAFTNIPSTRSNVQGKCFVLYGSRTEFPRTIRLDELNGNNGFTITTNGTSIEKVGGKLAGLGDINGDNINDIAIGGNEDQKFVIFGKPSSSNFPTVMYVEDLNGANGFAVEHSTTSFTYGNVSNAGDINDDGFNDIVFRNQYVLFGKDETFTPVVDLATLNGTNGFSFSKSVRGLNYIGDFNNDGYADLSVRDYSRGGIIYGRETWDATVSVDFGSHHYGIVIDILSGFYRGTESYAGDVNNDGFDDVIIGKHLNSVFSNYQANFDPGFAYVIFGKDMPDTEAPQITTCPSDQTLSSGSPLPDYTGDVDATDDCDTNLEITQDPVAGTSFTADTTVTMTVTDNSGKETQCSFNVTIPGTDTEPPTASNPSPINVQCTADVPTPDPLVVIDEDDNSGVTPTVAFVSDVSDGGSNPEVITRTYSVTDGAGNSITVTQTITINDTINPTASNPAGITVTCASDVPPEDITVVTDEMDNCTVNPIVEFVGDVTTSPGIVTRTYSVTDGAGNSITVTQTITINDTTNPTASNPAGITVTCASDVPPEDITVVIDEMDNCTANPIVEFVGDVTTSTGIVIRTYSVTDIAGNSITVTQTITVNDTTDPTASNPSPINVQCTDDVPLPDVVVVTDEADNCGVVTVAFEGDVSDGNSNPEVITRTYSITDEVGNSINVTQTITVNDTTNPNIDCPANITQNVDLGLSTAIVTYTPPIGTDNCIGVTTVQIAGLPSGSGFPIGTTTNTFEVTDSAGNTNTCSFDIIITDEDPIICEVQAGEDEEIIQGQEVQLNATASGNGTFVWTPSISLTNANIANPIATPDQTTTYTVLFTSNQGCIEEDTVTVYVEAQEEDQTRYGFSPDGDGINEYWEIHNIENYPNNKVSIYNRWGDIVFEVEGYNNTSRVFRGIANRKRSLGGDKLPEGTYFFNINIEGSHNLKKQTGFLVLKR